MTVPDYYAFIDESGSEGDPDKPGGFEFLSLVAVVIRTRNVQSLSEVWDRWRRIEKKPPKRGWRGFKDTNSDSAKYLAARLLSEQPIKFGAVIGHKPGLTKLDHEADHGSLYYYLSQLLLERISWMVRDGDKANPERDPRVRIVFSERKNTAYDQFRKYVKFVKDGRGGVESKASWKHIDVNQIVTTPHHTCTYLQSADFIAGAIASAIELNKKYGTTDDRFMIPLSRRVYSSSKKINGNGLKIYPSSSEKVLLSQDRFRWATTHYTQV
ncbi:DUF3800 domain-containing protein [Actibacterium sp. MT2.3-13A]|uniref:DUF3800 domain-containing protein n=1 Tax=Actibacterium sp. MT2.3-13A TaxID=2828332 RepID=UPI001BAC3866|nr:DUF3800 domain-containing protein [Actibacterium sp. MT2.3-13A]